MQILCFVDETSTFLKDIFNQYVNELENEKRKLIIKSKLSVSQTRLI